LIPQHPAASDDSQHRPVHAQRDPLPRESTPIWRPARTIIAALRSEVRLAAGTPDQQPRVLCPVVRDGFLRLVRSGGSGGGGLPVWGLGGWRLASGFGGGFAAGLRLFP
jgi:hypothetical protein